MARRTRKAKPTAEDIYSATPFLRSLRAGANSVAGVAVDEKSALSQSAVYAAIRIIAETLATLPLPVYERKLRGRQRRTDVEAHRILNQTPDMYLGSVQWREAILGHAVSWGNGYSELEVTKGGEPLNAHLIPPDKVEPERDKATGALQYKVEGSHVRVPADRMIHVAGLGYDGCVGYSPIKLHREAIGLAKATEVFGSAWFGNGSRAAGVITHPGTLTADAKKNIADSLEQNHGGPENFGRWFIFGEGVSIESIGIPPEDAQFLQTRQFQIAEIARIFRINPLFLQDLEHATFSNMEQAAIDLVVHTLRPWAVRFEAELNRKLFGLQSDFYCEHLIDGLLRGDTATRYAAYAIGRNWGWLSADDICELENRDPLPDGQGSIYLVPVNMVNAKTYVMPEVEEKTEELEVEEPKAVESDAAEVPTLDGADVAITEVQSASMNGAQTTSLLDIVGLVVAGTLPVESARAIIAAAFPILTIEQIDAILAPLANLPKPKVEEPVEPKTEEPVDQDTEEGTEAPEPDEFALDAVRGVAADAYGRMIRREAQAVRRAAKKPKEFLNSLDEIYNDHRETVAMATAPAVKAVASLYGMTNPADVAGVCQMFAAKIADEHREALLDLSGRVASDGLVTAVDELVTKWEAERPAEIAVSLANYCHGRID